MQPSIDVQVHHPASPRTPLYFLLPGIALLIVALPAYFHMFFGFSWWDDEGYLLATVKAVVLHHILYDQIYTLYGPFYYLVEWLFYAVTGLTPSLDCVRLIGCILWSACGVLLSWPVYRMTRSFLLTGFSLVIFTKMLVFFQWSPGHPEEVCLTLLACLFALLCGRVPAMISTGRMVAVGVLAAAIAQTKINLGLYVALGLLLTLLTTLPKGKSRNLLLAVTGTMALLLVAGIMSSLFRFNWVRSYFCLFLIAFTTVWAAAFSTTVDTVISKKAWYSLIAAYVLTYAGILIPFLANGTTISSFLYVTIFQHKDFTKHWFNASSMGAGTVLWSACSLALFIAWLRNSRQDTGRQSFVFALQLLKGIIGGFAAFELLFHGINWPIGGDTMALMTPLTWLVLVPAAAERTRPALLARTCLAFLAVFVNLYAFPVARAQTLFAIVPLVPVIAIFLYDGMLSLPLGDWTVITPRLKRMAAIAVSLIIAASYARELNRTYREYSHGSSLALPGSNYIRSFPEQASTLQWITHKLDDHCPSFFSLPGLFSFDFWTRQDTPTLMMMNDWPGFLNSTQQQVVLRDLTKQSTACIVYNPELVKFFHAGKFLASSPLAQYIQAKFVTEDQRGGYYLMVRKRTAATEKRNGMLATGGG